VNFTEIEEHMKLAHEEFCTINSLRKSDVNHFEKQRLQDALRHYNKIREKYHTKKAEITSNILHIVEL
jgi:hypothetical protein